MYDLRGKVALVTGAGGEQGIGRAIAVRLAQEGADVAVNDIVRLPYGGPTGWRGVDSVVEEIEATGRRGMAVLGDVSDAEQVDRMLAETLERFGKVDILINNAASRPGRDRVSVVELEEDAWDTVQRINVKGTFLCCRAVARHLITRNEGGKIVNLSSTAGKRGVARFAAYCASKFAVIGFTQSLALELAPYRINVNAICPGSVDTERTGFIAAALAPEGVSGETYRQRMNADTATHTPLGRVAEGADIARMAAFLASGESDYLTGLSISVSGGTVMD
ncbi:MAG: glucose 1-dehydrogenase [candidate division Zixibacteria bacterium]|nr:glucose 1-dehydrogenase [candidate division Zixibacteria bacterium]